MTWSNLSLNAVFFTEADPDDYRPARVRPVSSPPNCAQLEGYLTYLGGTAGGPVTDEGSLPPGTYDTVKFHSIEGRCLNSTGENIGSCEILVGTDGTLGISSVPAGTAQVNFGDIYPVS